MIWYEDWQNHSLKDSIILLIENKKIGGDDSLRNINVILKKDIKQEIDFDRDLVSEVFYHNLNKLVLKEVNISLQKVIPNILSNIVNLNEGELDEVYQYDDVNNIPLAHVDEETYNEMLDILTFLFPDKLFIRISLKEAYRKFYLGDSEPFFKDFGPLNNEYFREEDGIDFLEFVSKKDSYRTMKSLIIGEYSKEFDEKDVLFRSIGMFHEVVILKNNAVITRGSNAFNQLDINNSLKIKDIYCGVLFTIVLYYDGRVKVSGLMPNLFHENMNDRTLFNDNSHNNLLSIVNDYFNIKSSKGEIDSIEDCDVDIKYNIYWSYFNKDYREIVIKTPKQKIILDSKFIDEYCDFFYIDFFITSFINRDPVLINNELQFFPKGNQKYLEDYYLDHYHYWPKIVKIIGSYDGVIAEGEEGHRYVNGVLS